MVSNGKLLGGETKENLYVGFSHTSHRHPNDDSTINIVMVTITITITEDCMPVMQ